MKYVVILRNSIETPVIFPETESHTDHVNRSLDKILSAGFCRFGVDPDSTLGVSCWGKSDSLRVLSRLVEDEDLILRHNEFSA